jgi:hypothetical protein
VQALFVLDSSQGWSAANTTFAVVGNVILHTVELYLAGLILVGVYHFGPLSELWSLDLQAYQNGNLSALMVLADMVSFLNRCLYDVGSNTIPVVTRYGQEVIAGNSILGNYLLGWGLSALLIYLIRVFIGI